MTRTLTALLAALLTGCNCAGPGKVLVEWDKKTNPVWPSEGSVVYGGVSYAMICSDIQCSFDFAWNDDTEEVTAAQIESVRLRVEGVEEVLDPADADFIEQAECRAGDELVFTWSVE